MKNHFLLTIISIAFLSLNTFSSEMEKSGKDPKSPVQIEFEKGESSSARNFFEGLVNLIVEVDVQFRRIEYLDLIQTSTIKEFKQTHKSILKNIKYARKIFSKYKEPRWKLQSKFLKLSHEWLDQIEHLSMVHLKPLLNMLVIPDDDWTDADIKKWDNYAEDYKIYYEVDSEWVDYQYIFAEANDFELSGTIDEEEMIRSEGKE